MSLRKLIRNIHKILGLSSGIVVFIVAITGCCWVFNEEIAGLSGDDFAKVKEETKPFITPTTARQITDRVFPGKHIHGVLYGKRNEAIEVIYYQDEPEFYQSVFLNPYSGEVLQTKDHLSGFFAFLIDGHINLWLPDQIGNEIVRWACVVFVVLLITGLVLWWPRNKNNRKQRLKFDWKESTRWKRKNFDMHSIIGFYASFLALIIVLTGLVMAFDWFQSITYKTLGGEKEVAFSVPDNTTKRKVSSDSSSSSIDQLVPFLNAEFPQAEQFEIHYPHSEESSIYVEITYDRNINYSADYRFYDQLTLNEIETPGIYGKYADAQFSDKVMRMNYDIHIGTILGLPGKIIVFLASLLIASLPVTGFLIWWGRRKKTPPYRPAIQKVKKIDMMTK